MILQIKFHSFNIYFVLSMNLSFILDNVSYESNSTPNRLINESICPILVPI